MSSKQDELLQALHDVHGPALTRFVSHMTHDASFAQDVVQEALLRAWKHPEILAQSDDAARAWLFTVARNLVIDVLDIGVRSQLTCSPNRAVPMTLIRYWMRGFSPMHFHRYLHHIERRSCLLTTLAIRLLKLPDRKVSLKELSSHVFTTPFVHYAFPCKKEEQPND